MRTMLEDMRRSWPDRTSDVLVERLAPKMFEYLTQAGERGDVPLSTFLRSRRGTGLEQRLLSLFGEVMNHKLLSFRWVSTETVGARELPVAEFGVSGTALPDGFESLVLLVSAGMFSLMTRCEGEVPYLNMRVLSVVDLAGATDRVELVNNSACSGRWGTIFERDEMGEVLTVKEEIETTLKKDGVKRAFFTTYKNVGEICLGDGGFVDGVLGLNEARYAVFCQENPEWAFFTEVEKTSSHQRRE